MSAPRKSTCAPAAFTLSAWIKLGNSVTSLDSWTNVYPITCNGLSGQGYNGFDLCVIGEAGLWLRIGSDMGNGGPYCWTATADVRGELLNHEWHLVTVTRDNFGVVRLYFDGALVGTEIGIGYSVTNTNPNSKLTIGFDSSQNQYNYFNGTIADCAGLQPGFGARRDSSHGRSYLLLERRQRHVQLGRRRQLARRHRAGRRGRHRRPWATVDSGTATITLESSQTVSGLTFSPGAGGSYALYGSGGNSLQLAGSGSSASISLTGGSDAINAPLVLENNVNVTTAGGTSLTISGGISQNGGSQALTLSGSGSLTLFGTDTCTGGTIVSAGTLILKNSFAIAPNTSLTVGAGGTVIFDGSSSTISDDATTLSNAASVATSSDTSVTSAAPLTTNAAPSNLVLLAPMAADVSTFDSVAMPRFGVRLRLRLADSIFLNRDNTAGCIAAASFGQPVCKRTKREQVCPCLRFGHTCYRPRRLVVKYQEGRWESGLAGAGCKQFG